jgi:ABC-type branched-subunit amino acid transport system substrate-binding protein
MLVYVVGDFKNEDSHQKVKEAFLKDIDPNLEIDNVKINFKYQEAQEGEAQTIAAQLASKDDTLLVVGHLSSTATKNALPQYMHVDPPIPVILAAETNPQLLPPDNESTYYPVLQISSTDEVQAKRAAAFAKSQSAQSVWVVEDVVVNPVYSHYLAKEFVKQIHLLQSSKDQSPKVLLWTTNQSPSANAISALNIDFVFFAGSWSSALILTRQINEVWKHGKKPHILLSSWCTNDELINEGGSDVDGVFLTYPTQANSFNAEGYGYWGRHAYKLTAKLIQEANNKFEYLVRKHGWLGYTAHRWLHVHRVADLEADTKSGEVILHLDDESFISLNQMAKDSSPNSMYGG